MGNTVHHHQSIRRRRIYTLTHITLGMVTQVVVMIMAFPLILHMPVVCRFPLRTREARTAIRSPLGCPCPHMTEGGDETLIAVVTHHIPIHPHSTHTVSHLLRCPPKEVDSTFRPSLP